MAINVMARQGSANVPQKQVWYVDTLPALQVLNFL